MRTFCPPPDAAPQPTVARQWRQGQWQRIDEVASREERLRVIHDDTEYTLWAWPHDLLPLALGHALLDGADARPLGDTPLPPRQGSAVRLPAQEDGAARVRVTLTPLPATAPPPRQCPAATAARVAACMEHVMRLPGMWSGTGCFHRAALVDLRTDAVLLLSEDIGRHNCVDRLAGQCCLQGLQPAEFALFISARITASLYAKARRAGFSFIVSRAAITSAALQAATAQGTTLVGFCRPAEERLTVFADATGRISA